MQARQGNQKLLKQYNKSKLLSLINLFAPISRTDLVQKTGLSPTTVSTLIEESLHEGIVIETGSVGEGVGRKATLLEINARGGFVVGVDLSFATELTLLNLRGELLVTQRMGELTDENLADLPKLLDVFIREQKLNLDEIKGIGISLPGILDEERKKIVFSYNLNVRHYPLHDLVANVFQVPIHLVNDVNAAAFAEQCSGNAVGCHSLVYTLLSRGVGTGIILRNEIYDTGETGNSIMASAFDDEKTIFQPLNVYSIYNLSKGLRQRYPHEFTDTLDNHSVIDRFFTLAFQQNQDPYLSEAKKIAHDIVTLLCNYALLLKPEKVLVNGWIAEQHLFFEYMLHLLQELEKTTNVSICLEKSYWKEKGPSLGAARLALHHIFKEMQFS
ncbi:ROK-family transcriptional regulator [Bacillus sp. JCM 19046]|uniref:NBD/HSP70 family sugar kinase n=1 Tax=Shouchella xiaoxiensis TaxID=766895 RepID=A0ABS2SRH3_9BACI|nr:ROK family protein [Shouchella xiaoxiensis]MBM7837626.1 putative NBD/HSP70 family sugar kinase [Shouchella xiaoxiensis]GAF12856.1 ROK-family transcriptional regulator [Bacillus sp. JCM 19045]GAF16778.1 ROK-family transcriptional regulator [Bacillus sp. JCM 19046]